MSDFIDVAIIGAGPAGAVAAANLQSAGLTVRVVEQAQFPRFSIGESLLPQSMIFMERAGLLGVFDQPSDFHFKDGAAFNRGDDNTTFDFSDKFTAGYGTTFQVKRADFDHLLIQEAQKQGVSVDFGHRVQRYSETEQGAVLTVVDLEQDREYDLNCRFVLDASGFGRVLPRLLDLEYPSDFPVRQAVFTHIEDRIDCPQYDRNKILITVMPSNPSVWFWLIPFSDGRASLGVVADKAYFDSLPDGAEEAMLKESVRRTPVYAKLLENAVYDTPVRTITGYAANVKRLYGERFALLGNAAEFLDPVFSSGVTIAMKSADLASQCLLRQFQGETVNWQRDYADALQKGIDTFRTFVNAWYDTRFQSVIFHPDQNDDIRRMICAILAGYAWDENNPYVSQPERRLSVLAQLCDTSREA